MLLELFSGVDYDSYETGREGVWGRTDRLRQIGDVAGMIAAVTNAVIFRDYVSYSFLECYRQKAWSIYIKLSHILDLVALHYRNNNVSVFILHIISVLQHDEMTHFTEYDCSNEI